MSKASAKPTVAAPLKALGGWPNADWFTTSVLLDNEVVGFTLPKLHLVRKQSFRIVGRSGAREPAGQKLPGRVTTNILSSLAPNSVVNEAAFRRTTFLFETAPVLHFARVKLASLKITAANKLRVALIESGYRGCVLHLDEGHATAMFWPSAEKEITDFVREAHPTYALHAQFDEAEDHRGVTSVARDAPDERRATAGLRRTNARLLQEVANLRAQVDRLRQSQSALGAMESLGLDDARLKSMLRLLHPDKHGSDEAANEAAKWINNLRDLLKGPRA